MPTPPQPLDDARLAQLLAAFPNGDTGPGALRTDRVIATLNLKVIQLDSTSRQADRFADRIAAVRALHSSSFDCDDHGGRHCNECGDLAPCATIRALDA